jgi:hypothetical protein
MRAAGGRGAAAAAAGAPPPQDAAVPAAADDDDDDPFAAVAVPPCPRQLGARVAHAVLGADGPLSRAAGAALGAPPALILELMRFGAVYYAPVMPKPGPGLPLSPEQLAAARAAHEAGVRVRVMGDGGGGGGVGPARGGSRVGVWRPRGAGG